MAVSKEQENGGGKVKEKKISKRPKHNQNAPKAQTDAIVAEMASEREDRIWQVGSERRQAEQEELQRGLVRTHPCA